MFTAVSLGVFDACTKRPRRAAELAARSGRGCRRAGAPAGWLRGAGPARQAGRAFTATSRWRRPISARAVPHSLHGYMRYSDEALYPHVGPSGGRRARRHASLDADLRHGGRASSAASSARDDAMRDFLRGMHGFGMLTSPRVVAAFDLSRFRRLVDLGGATGHLAIAACERYPELRAVVFDLPRVTALARETMALSGRARPHRSAGGRFLRRRPAGRPICIRWAAFCTTGRDEKIERLLRADFRSGCPRAARC